MKKTALVGFTAAIFAFGAAGGAYAATNLQEIKAFLNSGLMFKVNGAAWQPKDDKGIAILPITYNNSTYLPLRAVADALNVPVRYDATAQTIELGQHSEGMPVTKEDYELSAFSTLTKEPAKTVVNGKPNPEAFYVDNINSSEKGFKLFPNKKYTKLVLQAAAIGDDATLRVTDGKVELAAQKLEKNKDIQEIAVDISGATALDITFVGTVDTKGIGIVLASSYFK